MVVSKYESKQIVSIALRWIEKESLVRAVKELWSEVAQYSDNESFKESVRLLIEEMSS